MQAGETFRRGYGNHLWVVVSDPGCDPEHVLIINVTSDRGFGADPACPLNPGDNPFIKHASYRRYRDSKIVSVSALNLTQRITQQQLESYLWGAATLLRGTIDAGDYKQFIFPLLFYKRLCDVFDEETQLALAESGGDQAFAAYPENHRFQIPAESHWRQVRTTAKNVGQALHAAMRAIETANPNKLYGIFGDAQWTNKDRLSDAMLRDLVEHFSSLELTVANLPEDKLGNGYEYLIKKFADDSGHTAAEFYTNRTAVHLMTEMLQPQPGESIYDPTCGSGGMLLSCIAHLRCQGLEWRNVRLYGQERNLMICSLAPKTGRCAILFPHTACCFVRKNAEALKGRNRWRIHEC